MDLLAILMTCMQGHLVVTLWWKLHGIISFDVSCSYIMLYNLYW